MILKRFFKYLLYILETIITGTILLLCWVIPFTWGSALGSFLLGHLGPLLTSKNRIVHQNLKIAGFDMSKTEMQQLIKAMWQNLGRTFLEYMRLPYQDPFDPNGYYEIEGLEYVDQLIQDGKPGLLFSAHFGNWELGTYTAQKRGLITAQITRFLNNPLMRDMVNGFHRRIARKVIPKGALGSREIIRELKKGHHVSMLGDQKNDLGVAVPFFNEPAMTAKAFAKMAVKFDCPLLPFHAVRQQGVRCKIIYQPPLTVPKEGTEAEKITSLLEQMNQHIESWIREHPEQWFWVHRRWPKHFYEKKG